MYLLVNTNGSRYWRLKYRYAGKEKLLSIGIYPDLSLAEARAKRGEAKKVLANGGDPGEQKQAEKQAKITAFNNSFEVLALEWHEHKRSNWSQGYASDEPVIKIVYLPVFDIFTPIMETGNYGRKEPQSPCG